MNTPKLPPLPERLRDAARKLRTSSIPLADFIPLLQQAADAIAAIEAQGVPDGWRILTTERDEIIVQAPNADPGGLTIPPGPGGSLATRILEALCRAMLASAPPAPQCAGDPGECAYNGACMYACGLKDPPAPQKLPRKIPIPPASAEMSDVIYAEGWNQCCDAFFGGLPPQESVVITVTQSASQAPVVQQEPVGYVPISAIEEGPLEGYVAVYTNPAQQASGYGQKLMPQVLGFEQAAGVQQEPVACIQHFKGDKGRLFFYDEVSPPPRSGAYVDEITWTLLYTHPAQQAKPQPLSDEQWLAYILRHADPEVLHIAAFIGETIQSQGKWCLFKAANKLRKLVEQAYGIKE